MFNVTVWEAVGFMEGQWGAVPALLSLPSLSCSFLYLSWLFFESFATIRRAAASTWIVREAAKPISVCGPIKL